MKTYVTVYNKDRKKIIYWLDYEEYEKYQQWQKQRELQFPKCFWN